MKKQFITMITVILMITFTSIAFGSNDYHWSSISNNGNDINFSSSSLLGTEAWYLYVESVLYRDGFIVASTDEGEADTTYVRAYDSYTNNQWFVIYQTLGAHAVYHDGYSEHFSESNKLGFF